MNFLFSFFLKDQEFENHLRYLKFSERKFYTPRGMGHRKLVKIKHLKFNLEKLILQIKKSLPDIKYERTQNSVNFNLLT